MALSTIPRFDAEFCESLSKEPCELVLMPRRVGHLVIAAWPTVNGVRMTPKELIDFVLKQSLHFSCFCFRIMGYPYACEFTITGDQSCDGRAFAYCHFDPPRCGYFLDLARIYKHSTLEMEYTTPLLSTPPYDHYTGIFKRRDILSAYLTRKLEDFNKDRAIFLPQFFQGYLGDVTEADMAVESLSIIRKVHFIYLEPGQLGPKHSAPPLTIPLHVSRSTQTEAVIDNSILGTWHRGEGVSGAQFRDLVKKCSLCSQFYWANFYDAHVRRCGRADGEPRVLRNTGV